MTDKITSLNSRQIYNMFFNGIPGREIGFDGVNIKNLKKRFACSDKEAEAILSYAAKKHDEDISLSNNFAETRFIDFDHISICRSTESSSTPKCLDKTLRCRPYFPNESCFSITSSKEYSHILPKGNWNTYNYQKIREWLSRLEMTRDESQVILSDYDSTLIVGDTGPVVMKIAVEKGYAKFNPGEQPYMLEHYKELVSNYAFDPTIETPYTWWKRWSTLNPQFDANALSMGFAGMTVKQIAECVEAAKSDPDYPKAFPELKTLFNHLIDKGKIVGIISASPYLAVALTMKSNGINVPLWAIEGTDFYVKHPKNGQAVLLSNLVNSELLAKKPDATIDDVIKEYGDLVAMRAVHTVQPGQKGKGASGVAIAWRGIDHWNKHKKGKGELPLTLNQMRLVGYFGDNTAPFSDMFSADPVAAGNDQGMIRALVPEDLLLVNINRGTDKGNGEIDFKEKQKNVENFRAFIIQVLQIYNGMTVLEQDSISKGPAKGIFLPNKLSAVIPFMKEGLGATCKAEDGKYIDNGSYQIDRLSCTADTDKKIKFTMKLNNGRVSGNDTDLQCYDHQDGWRLTETSKNGDIWCDSDQAPNWKFRLEETTAGLSLKRYNAAYQRFKISMSPFSYWLQAGLEKLIMLRPEDDRTDGYFAD